MIVDITTIDITVFSETMLRFLHFNIFWNMFHMARSKKWFSVTRDDVDW